jgi:hypothetical protein
MAVTPVIIVPGVMGSRLSMPGGTDWDPDSNAAMVGWLQRDMLTRYRDLDIGQRANADVLSGFSSTAANQISGNQDLGNIAAARQSGDAISLFSARGWAGLAWTFYGNLLVQLETKLNISGAVFTNESSPVYAFGYDWRKSNAVSAQGLSTFTNQVLGTESADQAILVTHSMGGLVARAAFLDSQYVSKVRGVVHACMPSNGSVTAYRRFFTGCNSPFDFPGNISGLVPDRLADFFLAIIMGNQPEAFATLMSGLPGPMELLPNNSYAVGEPSWLTTSPQIDLTDVYTAYGGSFQPGIISPSLDNFVSSIGGGLTGELVAAGLAARISSAQSFHASLGSVTHPRTVIMSSTGLQSDQTISFSSGTVTPNQTATGDGTVNIASASCPTMNSALIQATAPFSGLEHARVFADDRFMATLVQNVTSLL